MKLFHSWFCKPPICKISYKMATMLNFLTLNEWFRMILPDAQFAAVLVSFYFCTSSLVITTARDSIHALPEYHCTGGDWDKNSALAL